MNLPLLPIWLIESAGSALMIVFSFLCVRLAVQLRGKDRENVVWTYLLWVSYSLAAFAISRAAGHFVKIFLLGAGYTAVWNSLRPYTGAINTMTFFLVASITLFFERVWRIYQQITKDRSELQAARDQLLFLNRNLEDLVAERTMKLALSERKYRRIFEASQDLMAVVSLDGRIVDINPAGTRMLGIQERATDRPCFSSFFQSEKQWDAISRASQSAGFTPDSEVQLKSADSTILSVIMNTAAERDQEGDISAIQVMAKDISQRKAMEQQLLLADKLASIGQLAAGIAHEINNPLSIILGYTQLLLRQEAPETQGYSDHKKIEKATLICKTVISDLLSFSRSAPTRKGVAHIHEAFRELISVTQHQFELDGIRIVRSFDPSLPSMVMDLGKIKQVFMNLIMNAKQAVGKEGQIDIVTRYEPRSSRAVIEVRDTGCGIDGESLPRIFDPFYTTKPTGEGTGLGLSVSYGIIKDHGGEILVESEPGKGSIFTVILPVVLEDDARQC